MKNGFKRAASACMTACLAAVLSLGAMAPQAAWADDASLAKAHGTDPVYRVTLYPGIQGAFSPDALPAGWQGMREDGALIAEVSAKSASSVSFDGIAVALDESSPYYVKGVRPAAKNNGYQKYYVGAADEAGVLAGSSAISQDEDFVVAYGLKSQRVSYTVRYVDADGAQIAPSSTFIGDIGDVPAPVAAYIEGYIPRANSVTKTLVSDESQNVLTFNYVRVAGSRTEILPGGVIAVVLPSGETVPVVPVPPAAGAGDAAAAGAEGAAPEALITADDGTVILDDDGTPLAAPVTEESLDDDATPLASAPEPQGEEVLSAPSAINGWLVGGVIGCATVGLVLFAILALRMRRKS